jgi:hypothetical protein
MTDRAAERQIAEFIGKYSPGMAVSIRAARAKMRALFGHGYELVYDNYNALVFGYSATQRTSDAFVSIAAYPRWVTLFFLAGTALEDPDQLLEGSGTQVRSIRLEAAGRLDDPGVRRLIARSTAPWSVKFAAAGSLTTVIKSVSARQRPRQIAPK